jgi:acetolactate synthase-1/2/3 large subunit
MTGAEYVAKFLKAIGVNNVYLVQGGACSFMVDAVDREEGIGYVCFQHEQAAAMAADAVYRTTGKLGATFCTSGPGASNLITGIACGYYDSIPSIHITGQVNGKEVAQYNGAKVRQAGFQQMDIVSMVQPVCNYAWHVEDIHTLKRVLKNAVDAAFEGRMGPVVVDIPMDVQTEQLDDDELLLPKFMAPMIHNKELELARNKITEFLADAKRPLVVFGAGPELAHTHGALEKWLEETKIPFVASWSALNSFNHDMSNYCGHFGVYGNRGGNYVIQNADKIVVFGSRLDNRQRSGNPKTFAPNAKLLVLDIDEEELKKYPSPQYDGIVVDLAFLEPILKGVTAPTVESDWAEYTQEMRQKFLNVDISVGADEVGSLNPYTVLQRLNDMALKDAMFFTDAGANHAWAYQIFSRKGNQKIFTSSGHYAMGYSLPAAIGARMNNPDKQVFSLNGDGGIQMNLQELQTLIEYDLDVKVVVFNNRGLGMIRQFQDTYMKGNHAATGDGRGPGRPDFEKIAFAYGLPYVKVTKLEDLDPLKLLIGRVLIEVVISDKVLIEPKLEANRPINDQFPYVSDEEYKYNNRFVEYTR